MKTEFLKTILILTQKELKGYFDNVTTYVVLLIFLVLWEFLFFRDVFILNEASLRIFFSLLPWLGLILIPAISMGTVAQERNQGTIEYLLTQPISELQFLLSKFLGGFIFVIIALILTLPLPFTLSLFGKFDWGIVLSQYLGSIFLIGATLSIGIFVSSILRSQMASLIASAFIIFILTIIGSEVITLSLPISLTILFEKLSLSSHFQSISRGAFDLRDGVYFITLIVFFLSLAYLWIVKEKYHQRDRVINRLRAVCILILGIGIALNVLAEQIPFRIDLSQGRLFSLSSATQEIVNDLPDLVNITLYASNKLPAKFQPVLRDTKDLLKDYQRLSKGKIYFETKTPESDQAIEEEAASLGINPIQFNVMEKEEFKIQTGYLGLNISYQGKNEAIPFIQSTADLEYELSSYLKKLTSTEKKKVVFLQGHGEKNPAQFYQVFQAELQKQYTVTTFEFNEENQDFPSDMVTLIIPGPIEEIPNDQQEKILAFLKKGGSVLILADGIIISSQSFSATANQNLPDSLLENLGLKVNQDLIYDLQSKENVTFGEGLFKYVLTYPLWPKVLAKDSSTLNANLDLIALPWASSIEIDQDKLSGAEVYKLFATSQYAGVQSEFFSLDPNQEFSEADLSERIVAVSVLGSFDSSDAKTRIILVGDSDFLADQFLENNLQGLAFALNGVDWLTQEEALSAIRTKVTSSQNFVFKEDWQKEALKYGNLALVFVLVSGFGAFRLIKRKQLVEKPY